MKSFDWFGIVFGLVGLLYLLSAIYDWKWPRWLSRGIYLPDLVGMSTTRIIYGLFGVGELSVGIGVTLQSIFASKSALFFIIGFALSLAVTKFLFNLRADQLSRQPPPK